MKKLRKLLITFVFMMFVLAIPCVPASAADKTIKAGQSIKDEGLDDYYKFTVPADGYIKVTFSKVDDYFTICDAKKNKFAHFWINDSVSSKGRVYTIPIAKGTYWFSSIDGGNTFKYTFSKVKHTTNYNVAKATKLQRGKQVKVVHTITDGHDRWYKITLTKKQRIRVWGDVILYNSDFETPTMLEEDDGSHITSKKMPKGTYYIRSYYDIYYSGYSNYRVTRAKQNIIKWR